MDPGEVCTCTVETVLGRNPLRSVKDILSSIRLANFYCWFIRGFSKIFMNGGRFDFVVMAGCL